MVEEIPGDDFVSRLVDSPHKWSRSERRFVETQLFELPSANPVESVVWRKHAPAIAQVHALGCAMQVNKRKSKASWTYEGCVTAQVAAILAIRNNEGDCFSVEHAPDEGQYHAHVGYVLVPGDDNLKKRKMNLKEFLRNLFLSAGFEVHECA